MDIHHKHTEAQRTEAVFGYQIQNSKKKFRHMYGDLNLDEIKNTTAVNGEIKNAFQVMF